jgi:Cu/Ag efflux pump CusA
MIARLIGWSARNLMLVFIGTIFAAAAGIYALAHLPLDAIPDLSDTQVIVYTEYNGQAPQVIEDQVTYPLTTAMLTVPKSKVVRGFSFFGVSFVYIIFEDGTDIYWARSRVLEYLNAAARKLPAGVTPTLGPDPPASGGSTSTQFNQRICRWPICARYKTGTFAMASPRRRASLKSRASGASSNNITSWSIPTGSAR